MNTTIASRLVTLRKEKSESQKAAAAALGVSQALLSHYEKGIRECGLDFLCRAAEYYGVSADYLLGISDTGEKEDSLNYGKKGAAQALKSLHFLSGSLNLPQKESKAVKEILYLTVFKIYRALSQNTDSSVTGTGFDAAFADYAADAAFAEITARAEALPKLPQYARDSLKEAETIMEKRAQSLIKSSSSN